MEKLNFNEMLNKCWETALGMTRSREKNNSTIFGNNVIMLFSKLGQLIVFIVSIVHSNDEINLICQNREPMLCIM
jgi:hypothetical protein